MRPDGFEVNLLATDEVPWETRKTRRSSYVPRYIAYCENISTYRQIMSQISGSGGP